MNLAFRHDYVKNRWYPQQGYLLVEIFTDLSHCDVVQRSVWIFFFFFERNRTLVFCYPCLFHLIVICQSSFNAGLSVFTKQHKSYTSGRMLPLK